MSNQPGFYVQKSTDKKLISTILSLAEKYPENICKVHFSIPGVESFSIVSEDLKIAIAENETLKELSKNLNYIINTIIIYLPNLTIQIKRGELIPDPSPLFDYVEISESQNKALGHQPADSITKIQIAKYLQNELQSILSPELISSNLPKEYGAIISQHNAALTRLEEANSDILIQAQKRIQELEISHSQRRQDLEESFNKKSESLINELQEKEQLLEKSHEEKISQLAQQELALKERSSKLDDRDNTHVRREIRDRMLNDVKSRISDFGVSRLTNRKRIPVLVGLLAMAAVFSSLLIANVIQINRMNMIDEVTISEAFSKIKSSANVPSSTNIMEDAKLTPANTKKTDDQQNKNSIDTILLQKISNLLITPLVMAWIKLSILSIGLIGTIIYYIKWQSRWADFHANSEFQLQQFYIDVNRANWVIESCLEWRKETGSVIPKELLQSITHNLFTVENKELEQVMHPADELASALLGKASHLKMNIAGNELLIEKPGKIKPVATQSK